MTDEDRLIAARDKIEADEAAKPIIIDARAIGPNASSNVRNLFLMLADYVTEPENWEGFETFVKKTAAEVLEDQPAARMKMLDWIAAMHPGTMLQIAQRLEIPGE
jgi:hypothetical protein